MNRATNILPVPVGQGRCTDFDAGEIHALVRLELAAIDHHPANPAAAYAGDGDFEQPVIQQDSGTRDYIIGKRIVGGGDLTDLSL